ncbi:MAG TPA: hypothetical protein PK413_09285 [Thermoanaerobaculia bacterium]|nr:hypothetical protein [Thermoanaerobaculia bacterium]
MSSARPDLRSTLLLLLPFAALATGCADRLTPSGASGSEVGVLLDGRDSAGEVNDRGFVSSASPIDVGNLSAGASNEVVGFTTLHPPRYVATPWTGGNDNFPVDFKPRIAVPVTVWIVHGPFDAQRQHAVEACIRTSAIWNAERMGVAFSTFEVRDATGDPDAPARSTFPNGDTNPQAWVDLQNDIGFTAGRLNIYWVNTVNGLTTNGWSNFGAQIAMGHNTGDELLSHEIGHAFSLTHSDGAATFDATNVMWSASNSRQFLTEGQLFRAHLNPSSILNAVYAARPGELTRNCNFGDATASCPASNRRLWADGAFPAN